jgi:hypothetical protein
MGAVPFVFFGSRGTAMLGFSGKIPEVCFTGIFSSKVSPRLGSNQFLGG